MRTALVAAIELCQICADWNLDRVEVAIPAEFIHEQNRDGSLISIHDVCNYFKAVAALDAAGAEEEKT